MTAVPRTLTLVGGPRDGRVLTVAPCAIVNVPEILHLTRPVGDVWQVGDEFYAITHEYDGTTGKYLGVRKWPQFGPWTWFGLAPFPTLALFPRLDRLQRRAATMRTRARMARGALRGEPAGDE